MKKSTVCLLACICLAAGFLTGRATQSLKTETRYEQMETRTGAYGTPELIPVRKELPEKAELPTIPVVVWVDSEAVIAERVDTAKIVSDYAAIFHYSKLLFDDTSGKLVVNAGVQYNRLSYLDYEFTPIREKTTVTKERAWTPFVSAGYSTDNCFSAGAGIFYHDIGIEYSYSRNIGLNRDYHAFFLKYKF